MKTLPRDIHIGMTVYDSGHKPIGTVEDFKFSENEEAPAVQPADIDANDRPIRRDGVLDSIADAFADKEIPEPLRSRLLLEGYIRLDTKGILAKHRYVLPSQIASSSGDEIRLNVTKDELIKRP